MFWNLKGFLLFTKKKQVVNNFVDNFLERQAEYNKHCFIFAALKQ